MRKREERGETEENEGRGYMRITRTNFIISLASTMEFYYPDLEMFGSQSFAVPIPLNPPAIFFEGTYRLPGVPRHLLKFFATCFLFLFPSILCFSSPYLERSIPDVGELMLASYVPDPIMKERVSPDYPWYSFFNTLFSPSWPS